MSPEPKMLVHDLTVKEVLSYIKSRELLPGARLPAERELAEQLKVSRNTIREAYLSLAAKGILSSHRGRGTFLVRAIDDIGNGTRLPSLADTADIIHLSEARQVLECGAIPFAIQRAAREDYQRLTALIADEEACPVSDEDGTVMPSVAFETEIVKLAGNPVLISMEQEVTTAWINLWIRLGLGVLNPKARSLDHYEILEAMKEGNVRLAQKAMSSHINSAALLLKKLTR